jgi:hypothetical protein
MLHRSMSGDPAKINPISPTGREHRIRLSFIIPKESWRTMSAEAPAAMKLDAAGVRLRSDLDGAAKCPR